MPQLHNVNAGAASVNKKEKGRSRKWKVEEEKDDGPYLAFEDGEAWVKSENKYVSLRIRDFVQLRACRLFLEGFKTFGLL